MNRCKHPKEHQRHSEYMNWCCVCGAIQNHSVNAKTHDWQSPEMTKRAGCDCDTVKGRTRISTSHYTEAVDTSEEKKAAIIRCLICDRTSRGLPNG